MELAAVDLAFDEMDRIYSSWSHISDHVQSIVTGALSALHSVRHHNDQPLFTVYGVRDKHKATDLTTPSHGSIINFNVHYADGSIVSPSEFARLAALSNIHLRAGSFCNPGALQLHLGVSDAQIQELHAMDESVCWNDRDMVGGRPMGSVRISFGAMSSMRDVEHLVEFARTYFVVGDATSATVTVDAVKTADAVDGDAPLRLSRILIYPIKSCGSFEPADGQWTVTSRGLLFDRDWTVVDRTTGRALQQKTHPHMALIRSVIDMESGVLRVSAPSCDKDLLLSLSTDASMSLKDARVCGGK